ncbi:HAMP domain-containing protein [Bradyrhizobium guangxiense]
MKATALESGFGAGTNLLKKFVRFARGTDTLTVAEKVYSIAAFLAIVTTFLLVMSVQSVRLQTTYRHMHASSAEAAIGVGRINALIYAIVMESRGIYMSGDRSAMRPFADGLMRRNRELAEAVKSMEKNVGDDDAELFASFRQRIAQFIEFRQELVRRGLEISPAAAREWGDNNANRKVRSQLNSDVEALDRIYQERAREADALANENRYAAAYLFALGLAALALAGLNVVVMRGSVVGALADITRATDRIAAGDVKSEVPHLGRHDEIGRLARAVQNFRDAVARIFQLEELETRHRPGAGRGDDRARPVQRQVPGQEVAAFGGDQQHAAGPDHARRQGERGGDELELSEDL